MTKTKHNHVPGVIALQSQNSSEDWNRLRQDSRALDQGMHYWYEKHMALVDNLDRQQTNSDLRFRTKLDKSSHLRSEIERFYKDRVDSSLAKGDVLTLKSLQSDLGKFKQRYQDLQYLANIGPQAIWRMYSQIVHLVSSHLILENYPSSSCEVFLYLKSYSICVSLMQVLNENPVQIVPQKVLDCQSLFSVSDVISNYINESVQRQELQNSQVAQIDYLRSQLDSIKVSAMFLRLKEDQKQKIFEIEQKNTQLEQRLAQINQSLTQQIEELKLQFAQKQDKVVEQVATTEESKGFDSVILNDEQKQSKMISFFEQAGCPLKQTTLLWRGTIHTFSANEFHKLCDNKQKTLTIVKTTEGFIIGGYTSQLWNHNAGGWKIDQSAWLFNIDQPSIFKFKKDGQYTMTSVFNTGPIFGGGHNLHIADFAHANNNSYVDVFANSYERLEQKNLFQKQGRANFTATEIEVFQV
ncbi:hypothetical protein FGO68_gene5177 [Halteria grandinella]|uniref:TLDc domain-containing protein n=1 Tax=Halteria grandinella TaxID=5974 RepID=A0A8J8T3R5_HALGN|nr:hypothetical protein FGO68_gene5177 [Halteria grandinella]